MCVVNNVVILYIPCGTVFIIDRSHSDSYILIFYRIFFDVASSAPSQLQSHCNETSTSCYLFSFLMLLVCILGAFTGTYCCEILDVITRGNKGQAGIFCTRVI